MATVLGNLHNVITLSLIVHSNSDKIRYVGAESHAGNDGKLEIETGNRI